MKGRRKEGREEKKEKGRMRETGKREWKGEENREIDIRGGEG